MSDFAPGSTLTVRSFTATPNADGSLSVSVNYSVRTPSGAIYDGQTWLWNPRGKWSPLGDLANDLMTLGFLARGAAAAATGLS